MILRLVPLVVFLLGLSGLSNFLYSDIPCTEDKVGLEEQKVCNLINELEMKVKASLEKIQNEQKPSSIDEQKGFDGEDDSMSIDDLLKSFDTALEDNSFAQEIKNSINSEDFKDDADLTVTIADRWQQFKLAMLTVFLESYIDAMLAKYGSYSKELSNKEMLLLIPSVYWRFNLKCLGMARTAGIKVWSAYVTEQYGSQEQSLTTSQKAWVSYVIAKTATLSVVKSGIDATIWAGSSVAQAGKNSVVSVGNVAYNTTVSAFNVSCSTCQSVVDYIQQWKP